MSNQGRLRNNHGDCAQRFLDLLGTCSVSSGGSVMTMSVGKETHLHICNCILEIVVFALYVNTNVEFTVGIYHNVLYLS